MRTWVKRLRRSEVKNKYSCMKKGVDYTGVAVVFFCHDGEGNFVMQKRGVNCRDENGVWDIGGGGVKFDERIEDAITREVKEEYGAEVKAFEFLGYRDVHREKDGVKSHWLSLDFKVLVDRAEVICNETDMFDELGWFRLDTLPTNLHSELPRFLANHSGKL